MKYFVVFLVAVAALTVTNSAMAQQKYPKGLYMSIDELVNQTPSIHDEIEIIARTNFDLAMNGGNDYELKSPTLDKKIIKRKAVAYSDGDTLYLNGKQFISQPWYAKVYRYGDYLVFDGCLSNNTGDVVAGVLFGAIGGAVAGAKSAHKRYTYAVKLGDSEASSINLDILSKILPDSVKKNDENDIEKEKALLESIQDKKQKRKTNTMLLEKYLPYLRE